MGNETRLVFVKNRTKQNSTTQVFTLFCRISAKSQKKDRTVMSFGDKLTDYIGSSPPWVMTIQKSFGHFETTLTCCEGVVKWDDDVFNNVSFYKTHTK